MSDERPDRRTGAKTRSHHRFRATAECRTCGQTRPGVTTVEHRPWGAESERSYHFCGECLAAIVERPLEVVLEEVCGA